MTELKYLLKIHNLYLFGWLVYIYQSVFGVEGSSIVKVLLIGLLIISGYNFFYANKNYMIPRYLKYLNILLIMFTIYGFLYFLFGDATYVHGGYRVNSFDYIKSIYISLLPIYSGYVFSKKGLITEKWLRNVAVIFLILTILYHYKQEQMTLMSGDDLEIFVNPSGYRFLAVIPLLYFWKKKPIYQYILLALTLAGIISSYKRGPMIIGIICFAIFVFAGLKDRYNKKKFITLLVVGMSIFAIYVFFMRTLQNSEFFGNRLNGMAEGDSSGRDYYFQRAWNYYVNNDNIIQSIFGIGANGTVKIMGQYAHNDWLEILINQGALGVLIYFAYMIQLMIVPQRLHIDSLNYVMFTIFVITFMSSLFSMSYGNMALSTTLCLGYCLSKIKKI